MKPDCMTSDLPYLVMFFCITKGEPCPICGASWEFAIVGERRFVALVHQSPKCSTDRVFAFEDKADGHYDGPLFASDVGALSLAPRL